MKKITLGIIIAGFIIATAGAVIAQGPVNKQPAEVMPSGKIRVIAPGNSSIKKMGYKLAGCTVVRELKDATALKCPPKIASLLNLREDRIFQLLDLEADTQINTDDVWDQGIDGTGVNVAILDTGIDMDHPEVGDSYLGGYDYVDDDNTPEDWHGHGTHVSGIITGNGVDNNAKGTAPGAGIYMYKVCGTYGCYESDMMAAMEAAVLTNAKVMNISIGGGNFSEENCDSDPLAQKVNWVANQGIAVSVSSGNDRFFVSSPACASKAIAVGAVDKTGLIADFSNFGPSLDIVAPGVSIYSSTIDGYDSWDGTSMAAPHIAGTMALMLQNTPTLTVNEIKTALYETATPINPASVCYGVTKIKKRSYWIGVVSCSTDNYGAGLVNAYEAVNYTPPALPVCGNGIIESGEECDITLGSATCETQGFSDGTLSCTVSCTFDTSSCTDPEPPTECILNGALCNCNGKCSKKESYNTCPMDCP